jgi:SAM-dependent methyltransferase
LKAEWDERYRRGEHFEDSPLPLFVKTVAGLVPGRALDLACGPGRHALHLAELGWNVTAVDSSAVAIEFLRERASERGLRVDARVADLEGDEFVIEPASFDLVCDTFYLQRSLIPQIREGVRPGGVLFAVLHVEDASPGRYRLKPGELLNAFAGWQVLHYEARTEQQGHRRSAAELIARRPITLQ